MNTRSRNAFAFLNEPLVRLPDNQANGRGDGAPRDISDTQVLLNSYVCNAIDAMKFNICYIGENEDNFSTPYRAKFAHQIFGQDETISGYRNLEVIFNFLPNSFHTYIEINYRNIWGNSQQGLVVDDIISKLSTWFPLLCNSTKFNELKKCEQMFKVHGELIYTSLFMDGLKSPCNIYVTKCNVKNREFLDFHKRFQGQIVFFIDAASVIQYDDHCWHYFYFYKDIVHNNTVVGKIPIGFCTVYSFEAVSKARIAQFFILPNYQQKGLGGRFLAVIYRYFKENNPCVYLTVESPCVEFKRMRDKLDLRLVKDLPQFGRNRVLREHANYVSMMSAAQDVAKITKNQTRHLYLILRKFYSRATPEDHDRFVVFLKRTIHSHYRKKLNRATDISPRRRHKYRSILSGDFTTNRQLHLVLMKFIRSIRSQLVYLANPDGH